MLRNFNTRTTEPSTSLATTPNTLSWKRSRLWFENTASSKGPGKLPTNFLRHYYDIHQLLDVEARAEIHRNSGILGAQKRSVSSLWIQTLPKAGPSRLQTTTSGSNSKRNIQRRLRFTIAARFRSTQFSPASRKILPVSSFRDFRPSESSAGICNAC